MRTLLLVSAVAAAAFASAQPVAKGFTYGRVDDTLPWKHLGWYDQNRFLLFDAELNGLSARSIEQRYAVLAASNRFAKVWTNEENEKPLAAQSKAWTAAHPQSGLGKKVFQYGGEGLPVRRTLCDRIGSDAAGVVDEIVGRLHPRRPQVQSRTNPAGRWALGERSRRESRLPASELHPPYAPGRRQLALAPRRR